MAQVVMLDFVRPQLQAADLLGQVVKAVIRTTRL
jgi:hypothetical protein